MNLTVNTFLTLDGVMQGPGSYDEDTSGGFERGGWLAPLVDADMLSIVADWYRHASALLMGRTTYEMMQPYWEPVHDPTDPVAAALNHLPKYLVSETTIWPTWENTTLISHDVLANIERLKAVGQGEIQVHGSHRLIRALHAAGMVDAYRILIFPVVVGSGKRLFETGSEVSAYSLRATRTTASGAVCLELVTTA